MFIQSRTQETVIPVTGLLGIVVKGASVGSLETCEVPPYAAIEAALK